MDPSEHADTHHGLKAAESDGHGLHLRQAGAAVVLLAEFGHLAWEHFHGGVLRHHILNRPDLPAISNGWGLILLPALTWFLLGRIHKRLAQAAQARSATLPSGVMVPFGSALLYGILLSSCFALRHTALTGYLFEGLLLLALLLPVYRAECVLGFVLGMTFVFGAVLPTVIASIIAASSMLLHRGAYPLPMRLWGALKRKGPPSE